MRLAAAQESSPSTAEKRVAKALSTMLDDGEHPSSVRGADASPPEVLEGGQTPRTDSGSSRNAASRAALRKNDPPTAEKRVVMTSCRWMVGSEVAEPVGAEPGRRSGIAGAPEKSTVRPALERRYRAAWGRDAQALSATSWVYVA